MAHVTNILLIRIMAFDRSSPGGLCYREGRVPNAAN